MKNYIKQAPFGQKNRHHFISLFGISLLFPTAYSIAVLAYGLELHLIMYSFLFLTLILFVCLAKIKPDVGWPIYYFFLCLLYFVVGYLSWPEDYTDVDIDAGRKLVAFYQFLPIVFAVLYSLVKRNKQNNKFFLVLMTFVLYIIVVKRFSFNAETIVSIRNFTGIFFIFLCGQLIGTYCSEKKIYLRFFYVSLIVSLFGLIEYFWGLDYWAHCFPAKFVSDLKNAGTLDNGVIGNKLIGINHKVYYRLSSFFYTPPHAAYNFVFYALFFPVFFKSFIRNRSFLFFYCFILFCFYSLLVFMTLIKAGWGQFVIALICYLVLMLFGLDVKVRYLGVKGIVFVMLLAIGIMAIGMWLYFVSGVVSTGGAHYQAFLQVFHFNIFEILFGINDLTLKFSVLNSDSGFATIVFSIGVAGYVIFVLFFVHVIKSILSNHYNSSVGIMLSSLLVAWFMTLHLTSSAWSVMGNFILFFSAGFFSESRSHLRKVMAKGV